MSLMRPGFERSPRRTRTGPNCCISGMSSVWHWVSHLPAGKLIIGCWNLRTCSIVMCCLFYVSLPKERIMSNKQPSDYQVRQRAIAVEQSFLVEAPAGSGKTELLTDRILALLAYVERPEDIVAITFTRKAAAEMHQRVMEKLQAGQQPAPTQAYQLRSWQLAQAALARDQAQGWELLNYPARLSIRTIDSLCAHLVQAMPCASRLGGVPAITEDALILYEQAAQNTLLMMDRFPAVEQLLRHLNMNFARAEELIVDMLGKRDQWLDLLGHTADTEQLEHHLQQR